jgi:hypothetical protein
MFRVYWTEQQELKGQSYFKDFEFDAIAAALQFIESLRARQRAGQAIRHITMSSENPDSIGKAGVADPPSNYQWKKRRI